MNNDNTNPEHQANEAAAPKSPANESAFDESGEDKGFSFEEVIFGDGQGKTQRGTPVDTNPTPPVTQPQETAPVEEQPVEAKNDEKRFEYWQSRAAKLENQLKETQPLVDHIKANPQVLQQPQQAQAPVQEQVEEFPPPPDKPERPLDYNKEAAYTDPSSSSARYENEVENWRDNMDEYNTLKVQYETAIVNEKVEKMETQRLAQQRNMEQRQVQTEKLGEVSEYVQAQYGLSPEETGSFMKDMSDPSSISMENLVTLWRMNNGKSAAPPAQTQGVQDAPQQQIQNQPSAAFQQTQRAQQVPQPMGVMSGQGSSNPDDGKTDGQKFMEALINQNNKNQIF
jgi:hypothetical protein